MKTVRSDLLAKVLACSAAAELVTGLALALAPTLVIGLLLGPVTSITTISVGRVAGIALLALGLACWPGRDRALDTAFRALLTYNVLAAGYLAYLGTTEGLGGFLLWPAVALHAAVAALMLYLWTTRSQTDVGRLCDKD